MTTQKAPPKIGVLFKTLGRKTVVLLVRYTFNTIGMLISMYLLFLLMFLGTTSIGASVGGTPTAIGHTLDNIIVGFFLWFVALASYMDLSHNIMNEARWGTLEQLMMTPFGFRKVALASTAINMLVTLGLSSAMLSAMIFTTGRTLRIDLVTVTPLLLLVATSATGIGFALGGLALVHKRIDAIHNLMQFVFIGLVVASTLTSSPALGVLPVALPNALINEAMTAGKRLWELDFARLLLAAVSSIIYFVGGLAVFNQLERRARQRGTLAQY